MNYEMELLPMAFCERPCDGYVKAVGSIEH